MLTEVRPERSSAYQQVSTSETVLSWSSVPGGQTDAELVELARRGSEKAFELLVRRHVDAAHAVAARLVDDDADAEDVVQDAFIRALERLEGCRDPERFRAWLLTIVRNHAHNVRKRERLRRGEPLNGVHESGVPSPILSAERSEAAERIQAAMQELTELQREVVRLHDFEGLKHGEIGAKLGISSGASRFNLHAARKKLRALLTDLDPSEDSYEAPEAEK